MRTGRRVFGALALLALVFAPGQVLGSEDAAAVEAATLAPTFTSAELTRSQPATPAPVADRIGQAVTPDGSATAAALLALGLTALLVDAASRACLPVARGAPSRRRGPPALAL